MWNKLKHAEKPIVLYGMGNGADKVLSVCQQNNISVAGIFASDEFVRHNTFHGFTVTSYAEAKEQFKDMIVLVCFGTSRPEVLARITAIADEQELYIPDLPVYGEDLFTEQYYMEHEAKLDAVYGKLADEISIHTWKNLLQYRISGKLRYLVAAESDPEEAWNTILKPNEQEHFLDLGGYSGDTVHEFLRHVSNYTAITVLEPDSRSYKKLCVNTAMLHDCRRIQAVVGNFDGVCLFSDNFGRGSSVAAGGVEMPCVRVDSLCTDNPFTLINIDVEGAEKATIMGMEETIRQYKPKIQIAAYHRTEDYFSIPMQILDLNPSYRLYMRHFKSIPAWETNFYFI